VNAYSIVDTFEKRVAEFSGAKYAVAVDCCTHALFLCLKYINKPQQITIPCKTYVSVPMAIIQAGYTVEFEERNWTGTYVLNPLTIVDGAKRFRQGMYRGGLHCLSFHIKKPLPIGRGGMILTDDKFAYEWLKKARYDGREGKPYDKEVIDVMGYHFYMTPEQAAKGLTLMDVKEDYSDHLEDYPDLRTFPIFNRS